MQITTGLEALLGPRAEKQSGPPSGGGADSGYAASVIYQQGYLAPMTAKQIRSWRESNVWIFACIMQRRQEVSGADWMVTYRDKDRATRADKLLIERITELLSAPNPEGKNNSYGGLIEPIVDDVLCLDKGTMYPRFNDAGEPASLQDLDGARVFIKPGWRSESDGARYIYRNPDGTDGKELGNDELIVIQANPTTYQAEGLAPMRTLHKVIAAEYDSFKSIHILQKNRAPAGLLKMPGSSKEAVDKVKDMFLRELAGKSGIGFLDVPAETDFIELGSVNLAEQGAFAFYDMLIRAISAAFRTTTLQLNWLQDVNRATAQEQSSITDDGIIALLKLIQGVINREIVARFIGSQNVMFQYTQLALREEAMSMANIREAAGRMVNPISINDQLKAGGYDQIKVQDKDEQEFYDKPLIQVSNGQVCTVSLALKLPQYQAAPDDPVPDPNNPAPGTVPVATNRDGQAKNPAVNGHGQPTAAATTQPGKGKRADFPVMVKATAPEQLFQARSRMHVDLDKFFTEAEEEARNGLLAS